MKNQKKSIMGPVISVFVLVLIVSILAGLTFLFVANLKDTSLDQASRTSISIINETVQFDSIDTVQTLGAATLFEVICSTTPTGIQNGTTEGAVTLVGNVTLTSSCTIVNATTLASHMSNGTVFVSYDYTYVAGDDANAYNAINETEAAGAGIVGYLPLIFLAIIFGAILTLVLKIILPYINLGQNMDGF